MPPWKSVHKAGSVFTIDFLERSEALPYSQTKQIIQTKGGFYI